MIIIYLLETAEIVKASGTSTLMIPPTGTMAAGVKVDLKLVMVLSAI
jgi:hypothetical protein